MTNFAEQFARLGTDPEAAMKAEYNQGKNIADAASKTATLKHLIWSTLPNALKISNGKCPVPHFDAKAKVDDYIKSIPGLFAKTTFLCVTFYASNLKISMFTPNLHVSELTLIRMKIKALRASRKRVVNMCSSNQSRLMFRCL